MTTAQKNVLRYAAWFTVTVVPLVFSAGFLRHEIDGKEDRGAHEADMRQETTARLLQHVHDSAFSAVILDRVNDIACAQNPTRRYCR